MPLPAVQERSIQNGDKAANAPELSLRGGRRPTWQSHATGYVFAGSTLLSDRVLRDSHVASLLGMTNLGALCGRRCHPITCKPARRSGSAAACQKSPFGPFSPSCFPNCKINFCIMISQFCRCGGLFDAKGNPDGFLSHYPSLRNFRLGRFFDSLRRSLSAATDAIGVYVFVGSLCELRALLRLPRPLRGLAMAKLVAWHHRTNVIKIPEAGRSRGSFFAFELKWHTGSYRAGNRSRGGPAAPCACPARRYGRGRAQG